MSTLPASLLSLPHDVLTTFEEYQNARLDFASQLASHLTKTVPQQEEEISSLDAIKLGRSKAFQLLKSGNAGPLLKDLSVDPVPNVQIVGLLALAEMCKRDSSIAHQCISIVKNVVYWIETDTRSSAAGGQKLVSASEFRRVATHFLTGLCRHGGDVTKEALDEGILKAFVHMTQRFPPEEKVAGLWGLHYALQHNKAIAAEMLDFPKLLQYVLLSAKEPHPEVASIAISVLGSFAKYDAQMAQKILDSGAVEIVSSIWKRTQRAVDSGNATDSSITCALLYFLAQVIKHDENTLSIVVGQISFFPLVVDLFVTEEDVHIRQNALSVLSVLAQHPKYTANLISSEQSLDMLPMLGACLDNPMTQWQGIRFVHSLLTLNTEIIVKKTVENLDYMITPVANLLHQEEASVNNTVRLRALRLMQVIGDTIGKQWALFEKVIALEVLPAIVNLYERTAPAADQREPGQKEDTNTLDKQAWAAAESLIKVTKHVQYLCFLIDSPPSSEALFELALKQISTCLRSDAKQQKLFVEQGYLKKIQTFLLAKRSGYSDDILDRFKEIRGLFTPELLAFHTPNYEEQLLSLIK